MKKLLILGAIAVVGYSLVSGKEEDPENIETGGGTVTEPNDLASVIAAYDGDVVVDSKNFWFYLSGGKAYYPTEAFWAKFQTEHPGYVVETIPFAVQDALQLAVNASYRGGGI